MTIVNTNSRPSVPKGIKQFNDRDLKWMSESHFIPSGWRQYSDSPYSKYKKKLEKLKNEQM